MASFYEDLTKIVTKDITTKLQGNRVDVRMKNDDKKFCNFWLTDVVAPRGFKRKIHENKFSDEIELPLGSSHIKKLNGTFVGDMRENELEWRMKMEEITDHTFAEAVKVNPAIEGYTRPIRTSKKSKLDPLNVPEQQLLRTMLRKKFEAKKGEKDAKNVVAKREPKAGTDPGFEQYVEDEVPLRVAFIDIDNRTKLSYRDAQKISYGAVLTVLGCITSVFPNSSNVASLMIRIHQINFLVRGRDPHALESQVVDITTLKGLSLKRYAQPDDEEDKRARLLDVGEELVDAHNV